MEADQPRRRWRTAARAARARIVQGIADHDEILTRARRSAQEIERHAHDYPALVVHLATRLDRDLADVQALIADIRTWLLEPRPDPLVEDERRVGWPTDLQTRAAELAEETSDHADRVERALDSVVAIKREAHDNPALIVDLAVTVQADLSRLRAYLSNLRSEVLAW